MLKKLKKPIKKNKKMTLYGETHGGKCSCGGS